MRRGDVGEVAWTYSDLTGTKVRPAVLVQADFLNGLIDDTILVQITGTRHGIPGTEVEIDPAQETGAGLSTVSYFYCSRSNALLVTSPKLLGRGAAAQGSFCYSEQHED